MGLVIELEQGVSTRRDELLRRLVDIQYERNDVDFHRGTFRVRGDVVEIFPAYEAETAIRIEFFGDEIESIKEVDPSSAARSSVRCNRHGDLPGVALRHRAASRCAKRISEPFAMSSASGSTSTTRTGVPYTNNGSSSAACTTSRCSSRWASSAVSRTTHAISLGASRVNLRRRSSTISRKTFCSSSTNRTKPCRSLARCIEVIALERKRSSSTDFAFQVRSTTGP